MRELPPGLVRQLLPCEQEDRRREYSSIRIVHSHRISEFVENANEVIAHFAATPYLSFADVFTHQSFADKWREANVSAADVVVA